MKKVISLAIFLLVISCVYAEKIVFSAASMSGQTGNSSSTTSLKGDAYVKTETMEIQADSIEMSGEDYRTISAKGNVKGSNTETHMDFTCDELSYDRETKIAILQGNVNLTDTENDVKAQAQIIEYNQETDLAILQIKINLTQKDNVCTGSYAIYHKNEQLLEISGNAQVKQKDDVFRAQHITLDMDTQDITLGGNVKGTVTDRKETKKESVKETDKQEVVTDEAKTGVANAAEVTADEATAEETTGEESKESVDLEKTEIESTKEEGSNE